MSATCEKGTLMNGLLRVRFSISGSTTSLALEKSFDKGDISGRRREGIRCLWPVPHPSYRPLSASQLDTQCRCADYCWWCRHPQAERESPTPSAMECSWPAC